MTVEQAIVELLERRGRDKTICPSDAARALAGDEDFRPLMRPVRQAAGAMAARGELDVTPKGRVVDPDRARGAIRLRLPG